MKLLIDTNVILDVLLKRDPFYKDASEVLNLIQRDGIREYISASAVTDIYYIARKYLKSRSAVVDLMKRLLKIVSIAAVSEREIFNALELDWSDFEDSVQYSVAFFHEMEGLITRNPDDYRGSNIPVFQPSEILQKFSSDQ